MPDYALGVAANRDGSFGMAAALFKAQTGRVPWEVHDLPHRPKTGADYKEKVASVLPQFLRKPARA